VVLFRRPTFKGVLLNDQGRQEAKSLDGVAADLKRLATQLTSLDDPKCKLLAFVLSDQAQRVSVAANNLMKAS
jgi:hypothetical protein